MGETLACGTGSVAAAAAARSWGVVPADDAVRVRNPGGVLEVTLGTDEQATTYLAGPVRKVADVDHPPGNALLSNLLPSSAEAAQRVITEQPAPWCGEPTVTENLTDGLRRMLRANN